MKIAILIPDRGDRPMFLENCLRIMKSQTLQPDIIELVNDVPTSNECDITWRYRTGYDRLRNKDLDCILLIENDDWYASNYIETVVREWELQGRPDLFGQLYTVYYNIRVMAHFTMHHGDRSSAMNTLIRPDLNLSWCSDNEPYTDLYLWNLTNLNGVPSVGPKFRGQLFKPEKHICLGIKHGIGLCGGRSHIDKMYRYVDKSISLNELMDKESFEFYNNYFKKES